MSKQIILLALCSLLLAPCSAAEAQQPTKLPRIGFLAGTKPAAVAARVAAFQQGLREIGYVEGKNIVVSIDMQKEMRIASVSLRPSWRV